MTNRIFFWLAVAGMLASLAARAADLNGVFQGRYTSADGRGHRITFTLKSEGAKLTGTVNGTRNKTEILDGKVTGDEISFDAQWPYGRFHYQGKFTAEELKLTVKAGEHVSEMTAQRVTE
jgi:hypothetical protein